MERLETEKREDRDRKDRNIKRILWEMEQERMRWVKDKEKEVGDK